MPDPKDFLPLTQVTFQLLVSLMKAPMHGYGLARDVEERTSGRVRLTAGTLYAGLQRMTRDGLIEESEAPPDQAAEASTRWRFYSVTALGKRALAAEVRRMEEDVRTARSLLPKPRKA